MCVIRSTSYYKKCELSHIFTSAWSGSHVIVWQTIEQGVEKASLPESEAIKLNVELHVLSIVYLYRYVGNYTGNVNWTVLNAFDHILVKAVI